MSPAIPRKSAPYRSALDPPQPARHLGGCGPQALETMEDGEGVTRAPHDLQGGRQIAEDARVVRPGGRPRPPAPAARPRPRPAAAPGVVRRAQSARSPTPSANPNDGRKRYRSAMVKPLMGRTG